MRGLAFLGAVLLAGPALAAEPPAALAPYVEDGSLRAGDYGWARGAFDGADPQDKAAYELIVAWRDACFEDAREELQTELAALGASLPDGEDTYSYGPLLCLAASPPTLDAFANFAELEAASAGVMPLYASYLAASDRAEQVVLENASTLSDELIARMVGDQVLRRGIIFAVTGEGPFSALEDGERGVLYDLLNKAAMARDLAHRQWLGAHVAEHGWPTISEVGELGAQAAQLLARHADLDPAFQLRALRLMEPLAASGEANSFGFVNLSDRTSLQLSGTQRYGTQLYCPDGWREPMPLEDPARVDEWRASVGLGPLAAHVDAVNESGGPC